MMMVRAVLKLPRGELEKTVRPIALPRLLGPCATLLNDQP